MSIIVLILYFFAGAIWGSFLGVIVERLNWRKGKWHLDLLSPSHCKYCKHKLSALDLIPIFSFLALKGKCHYCQKPIGWQILLVEIYSGLIFVLSYISFFDGLASWPSLALGIILGSVLGIIIFYDAKSQLIPDPLILILILLSFIRIIFNLAPKFYSQSNLWQPILGSLIICAFLFLIYFFTRGKGMGLGDAKLGLALGLFLSIKLSVLLIWLAFIFGGIIALIILILRLKKASDRIAFAPFLIISFLIIYFLPGVVNWFSILW